MHSRYTQGFCVYDVCVCVSLMWSNSTEIVCANKMKMQDWMRYISGNFACTEGCRGLGRIEIWIIKRQTNTQPHARRIKCINAQSWHTTSLAALMPCLHSPSLFACNSNKMFAVYSSCFWSDMNENGWWMCARSYYSSGLYVKNNFVTTLKTCLSQQHNAFAIFQYSTSHSTSPPPLPTHTHTFKHCLPEPLSHSHLHGKVSFCTANRSSVQLG